MDKKGIFLIILLILSVSVFSDTDINETAVSTGSFYGSFYDWVTNSSYLNFDGKTLNFYENILNGTITNLISKNDAGFITMSNLSNIQSQVDNLSLNYSNINTNVSNIYSTFLRYAGNPYLYVSSQTVYFNDTYSNASTISICSIYNDTNYINSINTTQNIMSLINSSNLIFQVLRFNKTSGIPANLDNGTMYYTDGIDAHYNLVMDSSANVIQQIGEEVYYPSLVKNDDTVTIDNCMPVKISGSSGVNVLIKRANTTTYRRSQATIGLATQTIAVNGFGRVTTFGSVNNCDTSEWNEGDSLYLNSTGGLTNVFQPKNIPSIYIGTVVRQHATLGRIDVNVVFNPSLDDLTYVNASLFNGEFLVYNSTTNMWQSDNITKYNNMISNMNNSLNSINTTSNIQSLGFNTTSQLNTLYMSINTVFNDTWWNITGSKYLINVSNNLRVNESQLNATSIAVCSIYNDTNYINGINSTIWQTLNLKLDATDQRYNDTNYINGINQTLWQQVNLKGNLNGNNIWIGNNSFLGEVIIYNSTQTNYNTSIILKDGLGFVVFNVSYGDVYIGNSLKVNGNINGTNFYGNINASYVLNPYWLTATDQRYNDTNLILSVNSSLWGNLTKINTTSNIQSLGFNTTSQLNTLYMSINTVFNDTWWNITGSKYLVNESNKLRINETQLNATSLAVCSIYNDTSIINAVNTTQNIMNLGFLNSTADLLQDSNLTRTYMTNGSIINASQINATSINVNSGNLTITSRYKICYDDGACRVFTCYNGTSLIMSNNATGITC